MAQKVELNDNQKIIISMTDQLSDLAKAKIRLMFLNRSKEVQDVKDKYNTLSEIIDSLIAKEMEQWNIDKQSALKSLNKTNAEIDDSIDHIKKNLKTTKKVVKLLKQADKVIEVGTEILATFP